MTERRDQWREHLPRARELHASTIVADMHSDIPTDVYRRRARGEERVIERLHLPRLRAGGVTAVGMALNNDSFVGGMQTDAALRRVVEMLDAMESEAAESPDLAWTRSAAEIVSAAEQGRLAMLVGLEGGAALGERLGTLRTLYRLGVRVVCLTWNYRNPIGDGVAEEHGGGGLTRFGVAAVKEMQRLGILVDVSHLTPRGVEQVLAVAERPIVASHSNARAYCPHRRNLSDAAIEGIARTGGVVGVCFYPGFIDAEQPSLERLLDHVDHIVRLVGDDHVAIGADFVDYMQEFIDERLAASGVYQGHSSVYPAELAGIDQIHNFTAGLLARGYSTESITKILGRNFLRVCRDAIG